MTPLQRQQQVSSALQYIDDFVAIHIRSTSSLTASSEQSFVHDAVQSLLTDIIPSTVQASAPWKEVWASDILPQLQKRGYGKTAEKIETFAWKTVELDPLFDSSKDSLLMSVEKYAKNKGLNVGLSSTPTTSILFISAKHPYPYVRLSFDTFAHHPTDIVARVMINDYDFKENLEQEENTKNSEVMFYHVKMLIDKYLLQEKLAWKHVEQETIVNSAEELEAIMQPYQVWLSTFKEKLYLGENPQMHGKGKDSRIKDAYWSASTKHIINTPYANVGAGIFPLTLVSSINDITSSKLSWKTVDTSNYPEGSPEDWYITATVSNPQEFFSLLQPNQIWWNNNNEKRSHWFVTGFSFVFLSSHDGFKCKDADYFTGISAPEESRNAYESPNGRTFSTPSISIGDEWYLVTKKEKEVSSKLSWKKVDTFNYPNIVINNIPILFKDLKEELLKSGIEEKRAEEEVKYLARAIDNNSTAGVISLGTPTGRKIVKWEVEKKDVTVSKLSWKNVDMADTSMSLLEFAEKWEKNTIYKCVVKDSHEFYIHLNNSSSVEGGKTNEGFPIVRVFSGNNANTEQELTPYVFGNPSTTDFRMGGNNGWTGLSFYKIRDVTPKQNFSWKNVDTFAYPDIFVNNIPVAFENLESKLKELSTDKQAITNTVRYAGVEILRGATSGRVVIKSAENQDIIVEWYQGKKSLSSAYIRDIAIDDLPEEIQKDVVKVIGKDSYYLEDTPKVILYGMVVSELLSKVDPHNFELAQEHIKDSEDSKDDYFKQKETKYILLMNDRIVDGHHFLAKAQKFEDTSSLHVLDLTPLRVSKEASQEEDLNALIEEGRKFYPNLHTGPDFKGVMEGLRFYPQKRNKGSYSIGGFKSEIARLKIEQVVRYLTRVGYSPNSAKGTNSVYMRDFKKTPTETIRVSDHGTSRADLAKDIRVLWNTNVDDVITQIDTPEASLNTLSWKNVNTQPGSYPDAMQRTKAIIQLLADNGYPLDEELNKIYRTSRGYRIMLATKVGLTAQTRRRDAVEALLKQNGYNDVIVTTYFQGYTGYNRIGQKQYDVRLLIPFITNENVEQSRVPGRAAYPQAKEVAKKVQKLFSEDDSYDITTSTAGYRIQVGWETEETKDQAIAEAREKLQQAGLTQCKVIAVTTNSVMGPWSRWQLRKETHYRIVVVIPFEAKLSSVLSWKTVDETLTTVNSFEEVLSSFQQGQVWRDGNKEPDAGGLSYFKVAAPSTGNRIFGDWSNTKRQAIQQNKPLPYTQGEFDHVVTYPLTLVYDPKKTASLITEAKKSSKIKKAIRKALMKKHHKALKKLS